MEERSSLSTLTRPPSGDCLFSGDLAFCTLADLLQLVCTCHSSAEIELSDERDEPARIVVANGLVVHAAERSAVGEAAFFAICARTRGQFRVFAAADDAARQPTTMRLPWRELLFEAARRQDESARPRGAEHRRASSHELRGGDYVELSLSTMPPPPSARDGDGGRVIPFRSAAAPVPVTATSEAAEPALEQQLAAAMRAYLDREFARALAGFERCLQRAPGDRRIELMIERVHERLRLGR